MATSGKFKKTARQSRNITVEDSFDKGIYMTDAALETGRCGNLVNFRIDSTRGHLIPRGGLQPRNAVKKGDSPSSDTLNDVALSEFAIYYPIRSDLLINTNDEVHNITLISALDDQSITVPGVGGVNNKLIKAKDVRYLIDTDAALTLKSLVLQNDITFFSGPVDGVKIIKDLPAFETLPEQLGCVLLNNFIGLNVASGAGQSGGLYKYNVTVDSANTDVVTTAAITPKDLTPAFAVNYGYNMLKANPYNFVSTAGPAWILNGLLPYETRNNTDTLALDYRTGRILKFKLYFEYPTETDFDDFLFKYQYRLTSSDSWTNCYINKQPSSDDLETYCRLVIPDAAFQIKVDVVQPITVGEGESAETIEDVVVSEIYNFSGGNAEDNTTKITTPNYDLTKAQGIFSWKRRVGLFGVTSAPNVIFLSDIDDPSYFPYPNNIIEYDYPVLKAINFLDDILVFTTDGIYQTSLGTDGKSYITDLVVGNIHLTPSDMYSVQPIKNMLFYKAGNRYYMLVPSTRYATLGQLQVAPVSAPIDYLLDNFEKEFRKILQAMYGDWFNVLTQTSDSFIKEEDEHILIPTTYSSFVDGDLVCLNYGFYINATGLPSVHFIYTLIYDTLNRVWLSDITELSNSEVLNLYKRSVLGRTQYILTNASDLGEFFEGDSRYTLDIAVLQHSTFTNEDYTMYTPQLPTRQHLDTGYRDIEAAWKKRFREIQIKLSTTCSEAIYLNPKFKIDNELRNDGNVYRITYEAPLYYIACDEFYLVAAGDQRLETNGEDYAPGAESDLYFKLGQEQLTTQALNIIRFKTTGKGRCPRLQLNVHTDVPYELHNVAWVFRNMNAR